MALDFPSEHGLRGASRDQCFVCGSTFGVEELTREHVFAKWLQHKHDLWNKKLVLLNRTPIKYCQLLVPSCAPCNNVVLSRLENEVARAAQGGAKQVRALGHEKLFTWIAKTYVGVLYAEALLPLDRTGGSSKTIISQETMCGFSNLRFLMQTARLRYEFDGGQSKYHTSIMVFPVQVHPRPEMQFMFRDDVEHGCVALRFGSVGIIYVQDGGAQEEFSALHFEKLYGTALHPIQFDEITALVFTKARSFNRVPKFFFSTCEGRGRVTQLPLGGLSEEPMFNSFDDETYVKMLSLFLNTPAEALNPSPGKIATWIGDLHNPGTIDVNQQPYG